MDLTETIWGLLNISGTILYTDILGTQFLTSLGNQGERKNVVSYSALIGNMSKNLFFFYNYISNLLSLHFPFNILGSYFLCLSHLLSFSYDISIANLSVFSDEYWQDFTLYQLEVRHLGSFVRFLDINKCKNVVFFIHYCYCY